MEDINFKHTIEILINGGKIKSRKYDESELTFYLDGDGKLISEDEHGLTTKTGLSDLELYFVVDNAQNIGDFIIEEISLNVPGDTEDSFSISSFENDFEKAILIGKQLKSMGYDLDDIYGVYNSNPNVMKYIDSLSPATLDLFDDRSETYRNKTKKESDKESDLNILMNNLYNSGSIVVSDSSGKSREYVIEGGVLNVILEDGITKKRGFLAETILSEDLEKIYNGDVEAGKLLPEIIFRDERAMERIRFGIDTARLFRTRLGFSIEDFEELYESDPDFRSATESLDNSIWNRADTLTKLSAAEILKDSMQSITSSAVRQYENFNQSLYTEGKIDKGEL